VGGFFGALLAAVFWRTHLFQVTDWFRFSEVTKLEGYWFVRREHAEPILRLSDIALSVFPVAWLFNRAGAALIHDHPGTRATAKSLFAVAYPSSNSPAASGFGIIHGSVPRYDLGLLELLVTLVSKDGSRGRPPICVANPRAVGIRHAVPTQRAPAAVDLD